MLTRPLQGWGRSWHLMQPAALQLLRQQQQQRWVPACTVLYGIPTAGLLAAGLILRQLCALVMPSRSIAKLAARQFACSTTFMLTH